MRPSKNASSKSSAISSESSGRPTAAANSAPMNRIAALKPSAISRSSDRASLPSSGGAFLRTNRRNATPNAPAKILFRIFIRLFRLALFSNSSPHLLSNAAICRCRSPLVRCFWASPGIEPTPASLSFRDPIPNPVATPFRDMTSARRFDNALFFSSAASSSVFLAAAIESAASPDSASCRTALPTRSNSLCESLSFLKLASATTLSLAGTLSGWPRNAARRYPTFTARSHPFSSRGKSSNSSPSLPASTTRSHTSFRVSMDSASSRISM
mmetsp:Transcript_11003/g.36298  ORF Transcript_11003/g.36298 Transcript_11003/m.36298 type:complete len:270 (-) Transcript_11003:283-1092(-)